MDLEALREHRGGEWERLEELARTRTLTGAEIDELVVRYRSASSDLAEIKTAAGRTPLGDDLSIVIARARGRLTGAGENVMRQASRFFLRQLPAALYAVRWSTLAVTVAFVIIAATVTLWVSSDPAYIAAMGSDQQLRDYVDNQFTQYYNPAAEFAGMVWTNNAYIAAQAIVFGITGLFPVYVLIGNAVGIGQAGAVLIAYDSADALLYLIPHGLLELTAIFVAVAAGLQVFWSWVAPGPRTRADSLARAGRSLGTIVVGLILALALSGLVEGFVTGQPWPWWVRIGLGALALALFLSYMLILGRRAAAAGESGDLTEYEAGTPTLYAG